VEYYLSRKKMDLVGVVSEEGKKKEKETTYQSRRGRL
jgi:hypothetical protein